MPIYYLEDLDPSDRLIRRVPMPGASLNEVEARTKQRMNSYWKRPGAPGSENCVRAVDDEDTELYRWSWADEQAAHHDRQNMPFRILQRFAGNPDVDSATKVSTEFRFFRNQRDEAIAKAKEIMAEAAKADGRKTALLAVEVWDESKGALDPVFRYSLEDHFGTK